MVLAFMGLTSSRDVTVSRTLSTSTKSRPRIFPTSDRCLSPATSRPIGRECRELVIAFCVNVFEPESQTLAPGVGPPTRLGQAADRRWKPDSSTVRPRSSAGTAPAAVGTRWQPDPTSRRSGSPAARAPPAVDTRWRPDPTTPRSGNQAVAPSRTPGSLATGRQLVQEQQSGLPTDEGAFSCSQPAPFRGLSNRSDGLGEIPHGCKPISSRRSCCLTDTWP
jgi:hypothetical protein